MDNLESKEVESTSKVMENKEIESEINKTTGVATEEEEEVEASPHKKKKVEEEEDDKAVVGREKKDEECAREKETAKQQKCQDKNTCSCRKSISLTPTLHNRITFLRLNRRDKNLILKISYYSVCN